jgi:hypothetical protein
MKVAADPALQTATTTATVQKTRRNRWLIAGLVEERRLTV